VITGTGDTTTELRLLGARSALNSMGVPFHEYVITPATAAIAAAPATRTGATTEREWVWRV
jgi:hypothetical protein